MTKLPIISKLSAKTTFLFSLVVFFILLSILSVCIQRSQIKINSDLTNSEQQAAQKTPFQLYFASNGYIKKITSDQAEPKIISELDGYARNLILSPNSTHIAYDDSAGNSNDNNSLALKVLNIENEQVLTLDSFSSKAPLIESMEWSHDGKYLAANYWFIVSTPSRVTKEIAIYDVSLGEKIFKKETRYYSNFNSMTQTFKNDISALSWNPENNTFAYNQDGKVVISDLDGNILGRYASGVISTETGTRSRRTIKPIWLDEENIMYYHTINFNDTSYGEATYSLLNTKTKQTTKNILENLSAMPPLKRVITKWDDLLIPKNGKVEIENISRPYFLGDKIFFETPLRQQSNHRVYFHLDENDLDQYSICKISDALSPFPISTNFANSRIHTNFLNDSGGYKILLIENSKNLYLMNATDCQLEKIFENNDSSIRNAVIMPL